MYTRELFDSQTLLLCESMLAIVFAIVFLGMHRLFPQIRGAQVVALSFLLVVPDTLLVAFRTHLPPVVSVLMADTLLLASLIAMYEAVMQFTGGVNRRWMLWFTTFISFATIYFYTDVHPQLGPRLVAVALSMAIVRGCTAVALLRHALHSTQRLTLGLFGLFTALMAGYSVYRAVAIVAQGVPTSRLQQDALQSTMLATGIFYLATSGVCFLLLTSREVATRRRMEANWMPRGGALNRRGLEINLALELEGLAEHHQPLSVALIEIDSLDAAETEDRSIQRGVARNVANLLAGQLRGSDHIGRFSTHCFLLVFPNTALAEARIVADRCSDHASRLKLLPLLSPLSFTVGIAQASPEDSAGTLLARVEEALAGARAEDGNGRGVSGPGEVETAAAAAVA